MWKSEELQLMGKVPIISSSCPLPRRENSDVGSEISHKNTNVSGELSYWVVWGAPWRNEGNEFRFARHSVLFPKSLHISQGMASGFGNVHAKARGSHAGRPHAGQMGLFLRRKGGPGCSRQGPCPLHHLPSLPPYPLLPEFFTPHLIIKQPSQVLERTCDRGQIWA